MSDVAGGDTATAAAPSSGSTAAPPAAEPASTTPSEPSGTPAPAPTSLAEALRQDMADPGSEPAPSPEVPQTGPIPFDRHKEILEKARAEHEAKGRDAALAEYREKYGWAEKVDQRTLEHWGQLASQIQTDPVGFAQQLIAEVGQNPQYQPSIRSWVAKVLAGGRQAQPQDPMPQPDLEYEGQKWYSQAQTQKLAEWQERRFKGMMQDALAPFEQERQTRQQAETEQKAAQERQALVTSAYDKAKTWPHFSEHEAEIAKVFAAGTYATDAEVVVGLRDAYIEVVVPKISGLTRKEVLTDLETKAKASTVHPSRARVAPPKETATDFASALKEAMTQP